jgi:beta-N-acetylhexosaminidase
MRHPRRLLIIFSALIFGTISTFIVFAEPDFYFDMPEGELINHLIESMSDEEVLGQVFLVGYSSAKPTKEVMDWINQRNIGGVKIFGWNAGNLKILAESITTMQQAALNTPLGIPLFTATDQEGGWVRHVKGETAITPGNLAVGASGLPYDAYNTGLYIGKELAVLGINMNFAPTVDVYLNSNAHVIGPRAFSEDPIQTATLAAAYFKGMSEAGVICTAKHFPGHGNAEGDSHGTLPVIDISFEELWNQDLVPYKVLIKEGLPAIMSGHLSFPVVTGDNIPASISHFFISEVIRDKLHFEGIVITDDLYMHGVRGEGRTTAEICKQALLAGNDMIMLSQTPGLNEVIWLSLYKAMQEEQEFRNRIFESVRRILRIKIQNLKDHPKVNLMPMPQNIADNIPNSEGEDFFFQQACRSVTIIRDKQIPFRSSDTGTILLAGQLQEFFDEGLRRYPGADTYYFPFNDFYKSKKSVRDELKRIAPNYDHIIFCLANPNSLEVVKSLEKYREKIIVYSVLTPVYLEETLWIDSALAVYGWGIESFKAGYAVLNGDYSAEGKLPISLKQE